MVKKYASGMLQSSFLVKKEGVASLINFHFDTMIMYDSATGVSVALEVGTMDLNELDLLGDDEDSDIKLV